MPEFLQDAWAYVILSIVLIAAAVCDVRTGKIYNWITYPAVLIGFAGHFLFGGLSGLHTAEVERMGFMDSVFGLAAGFGPLFLAWLAGGIGGGDAKIMGAVGALAGWRFALTAMFYGFAVAIVMALIIMIRRRITLETLGRIWRFLWLTVMRASPAGPDGENSAKLPFGLALCIGSFAAMILTIIFGPIEKLFLLGL